jgi:hypothetical protein
MAAKPHPRSPNKSEPTASLKPLAGIAFGDRGGDFHKPLSHRPGTVFLMSTGAVE